MNIFKCLLINRNRQAAKATTTTTTTSMDTTPITMTAAGGQLTKRLKWQSDAATAEIVCLIGNWKKRGRGPRERERGREHQTEAARLFVICQRSFLGVNMLMSVNNFLEFPAPAVVQASSNSRTVQVALNCNCQRPSPAHTCRMTYASD